jgi:hypothetical protein
MDEARMAPSAGSNEKKYEGKEPSKLCTAKDAMNTNKESRELVFPRSHPLRQNLDTGSAL